MPTGVGADASRYGHQAIQGAARNLSHMCLLKTAVTSLSALLPTSKVCAWLQINNMPIVSLKAAS